ncbi:MAG TPA: kelch repeat-containing protein, partial [Archangium sp.]
MRTVKLAALVSASLLAQACGGTSPQNAPELVTRASALTTAVSRGCTFTVTSQENASTLPPRYEPVITRLASASCPWSSASVTLPGSYSPTRVSIAANEQGVAVSYTNKYS